MSDDRCKAIALLRTLIADSERDKKLGLSRWQPICDDRTAALRVLVDTEPETHINHFAERLKAVQARQEAELRRLCKFDGMREACQVLTDTMISNLAHLCNYATIIDGHGQTYEIHEVSAELERNIRTTFQRLTGQVYRSEMERSKPLCEQADHLGFDATGKEVADE